MLLLMLVLLSSQEALGRARKSVKPEDIEQYKSFSKNLKVRYTVQYTVRYTVRYGAVVAACVAGRGVRLWSIALCTQVTVTRAPVETFPGASKIELWLFESENR